MYGRITVFAVALFILFGCSASGDDAPAKLTEFVARKDPSFAWEVTGIRKLPTHTDVIQLKVTSQEWHGSQWEHRVEVFTPKTLQFPRHALLFVASQDMNGRRVIRPGDENCDENADILAHCSGMRVVVLYDVPHPPKNDPTDADDRPDADFVAESWLKFLETGDETQLATYAMVKSFVRAMDAIEQLAEREFEERIEAFVVAGAFEHARAAWLTPLVDKRVVAIAPMQFDALNTRAQLQHQMKKWGHYSEDLSAWTSRELFVDGEESPRQKQLRILLDPFTYRKQLALPKLLVNKSGDSRSVADSMQLYWKELSGPKFITQLPTTGWLTFTMRGTAMSSVGSFAHSVASEEPLPKLDWVIEQKKIRVAMGVKVSAKPIQSRIWYAESATFDFHETLWWPRELEEKDGIWAGAIKSSYGKNVAACGVFRFRTATGVVTLATPVYCSTP